MIFIVHCLSLLVTSRLTQLQGSLKSLFSNTRMQPERRTEMTPTWQTLQVPSAFDYSMMQFLVSR